MSTHLDKLKLVKARPWQRLDDLDHIGYPTHLLLKEAIEEGEWDLASDLAEFFYFWEIKLVRDADIYLMAGMPCYILSKYGEENLHEAYKQHTLTQRGWKEFPVSKELKKPALSAYEQAMGHAGEMGRNNRMGREDGAGGFTIEEYDDRYEVVWDPCYSGGRPRRGDYISNTPSITEHPFNYACIQVPHTWTGGRAGVNGWCVHCWLLHELQHVWATGGYLGQWIVGYPDNPMDACPYICYKDIDWIPEKYYTQLGVKKPPVTSPNPAPKNPKLIRVIHSDELPTKYQNTMRRLRKALNAKDKELSLNLVDILQAETRIHHLGTAISNNWGWMDLLIRDHGYNELLAALRSVPSPLEPMLAPDEVRPTKEQIPGAVDRVKKAAAWGRSMRSGPNSEGSLQIKEEPDRFVMELTPCGSGGRALIGDSPDEFTLSVGKDLDMRPTRLTQGPFTGPPRNLKSTIEANPVAWNKLNVPHFCTRCCVHFEHDAVAKHGYLTTVIERPANSTDPNCKWYFYKDLDDVPEEYYTRIGAKKPAKQK